MTCILFSLGHEEPRCNYGDRGLKYFIFINEDCPVHVLEKSVTFIQVYFISELRIRLILHRVNPFALSKCTFYPSLGAHSLDKRPVLTAKRTCIFRLVSKCYVDTC